MYLFRNIFRIVAVLSFLCLSVFFILEGCGGLSGSDEESGERNNRGIDRGNWRDGRSSRNNEGLRDEGNGGGGFGPYPPSSDDEDFGEDSETETSLIINPSSNQPPLSDTIDFLFIIDASPSNKHYIKELTIQKKLENFIKMLNEAGIDWRVYTTSSAYTDENKLKNGRLHQLEYNKTLIDSLYLDNHILDAYNPRYPQNFTSEVFIDTISHPQRTGFWRQHCKMPPFCHRNKQNRPLRALNGFLTIASKYDNVLREDADLVIIIISNQDEQPLNEEIYNPTSIQNQLEENFSDKTWHAIAFVVVPTSACKNCNGATYIPRLTILTSGKSYSIDSNTYAQTIIDFIKKKQGEKVERMRIHPETVTREPSNTNLINDIYVDTARL